MFFQSPRPPGAGIGRAVKILAALAVSCTGKKGAGSPGYSTAAVRVDYQGANRAVFFDFSTGKAAEAPQDFFDIGIFVKGPDDSYIFANSGSYGSGARVLKTAAASLGDDLSGVAGPDGVHVKEYTFRQGIPLLKNSGGGLYQTNENPFAGEIGSYGEYYPVRFGGGGQCAYIVKTAGGNYYKLLFKVVGMTSMLPPTSGYHITVVKGLDGTTEVDLKGSLSGITKERGYGYVYFDLDVPDLAGAQVDCAALGIPPAADWDLLFTRADLELPEDPDNPGYISLAADGCAAAWPVVLLNTYKGVEALKFAGRNIEEVFSTLSLSNKVDAIGKSWYTTEGTPPVFSVPVNTFVVKTAEGRYAKFQPESFYGPDNEQFYMTFRYLYSGDNSDQFDY
jgi:hypothetical protein